MKNSIAFGQYCEGSSFLHKLDPRWKLVLAVLYIVTIFLCKNVFSFVLVGVTAVGLVLLSEIKPVLILRSLKPLIMIICITAVINIFWLKGETLLWQFGPVSIYLEGIFNALLIVVRVVLLVAVTTLVLTYTTTPIALTDGLEQLLAPLARIKLPVHEFSMMMTIALRFIPTLLEETEKIMNAQRARGADFSTGSLAKRAKALVPILIPLFISAFRRAEELAIAMECRCYTGGEGRTRMNVLHSSYRDVVAVLVMVAILAGVLVINRFAPGYSISM
ncbi:MAG: energy-coupling factor transporter transmembrane protein EcfT [Clostridia bacterium]|nr:energy-coupling factor transporter transmembrane protein EcfT [Clostridia bacterium]